MIAWANFAILLFSVMLFLYFYIRSVSPAGLEMVVGPRAYEQCRRDRLIAAGFELLVTINYVVYIFFPLLLRLPRQFPWAWWVSFLIALAIGIPALVLMVRGVQDAGEETLRPTKEQPLFGGIYKKNPSSPGCWRGIYLVGAGFRAPFTFPDSFFFLFHPGVPDHVLG